MFSLHLRHVCLCVLLSLHCLVRLSEIPAGAGVTHGTGGGGLGRNPHPVYNYSRLREEQILNYENPTSEQRCPSRATPGTCPPCSAALSGLTTCRV
eukprot:UN26829